MSRAPLPPDAPRPPRENAAGANGPRDEDERFMADLADRIRASGLAPAATLWLSSLRPLSFLGSQALHVAAPLLDVFVRDGGTSRLATLLEDRAAVDRFLDHLDDPGASEREGIRP